MIDKLTGMRMLGMLMIDLVRANTISATPITISNTANMFMKSDLRVTDYYGTPTFTQHTSFGDWAQFAQRCTVVSPKPESSLWPWS